MLKGAMEAQDRIGVIFRSVSLVDSSVTHCESSLLPLSWYTRNPFRRDTFRMTHSCVTRCNRDLLSGSSPWKYPSAPSYGSKPPGGSAGFPPATCTLLAPPAAGEVFGAVAPWGNGDPSIVIDGAIAVSWNCVQNDFELKRGERSHQNRDL